MAKLTVTLDGIHGDAAIALQQPKKEKQEIEFKWCQFDENGSTGFISSITPAPIMLTEVAAEHFLRTTVAAMVRSYEIKPGDLTIINHLGEKLPDVQFLPPTFDGNESDLMVFVGQQDSILRIYSIYDAMGKLDDDLIQMSAQEGVVDDFLSLVNVRASGFFLAVSKPSQ